ncbi:MAG: pilus assembly protein [Alphaproteobacteria bacterium]|nr:pilus assembly protein [Alphaproteobacteria bacterium]
MLLRRLAHDTCGSVAIVFGVLFIMLIVGVGVAVDFARGAQVRAQLQSVVDAAALAGVGVYTGSSTESTATTLAQSYVTKGIAALPSGTTVTSTTITPGTDNGAYTMYVSVAASVPMTLMGVYQKTMNVSASATAKNTGSGSACILALNASASKAASLSGGSTNLTLNNCGIAVNSASSDGLDLSGGSWITGQTVTLGGTAYGTSGSSYVIASDGIKYNQTVADPYSGRSIPSHWWWCDHWNYSTGSSRTLNPGVYCGGITTNGSSTVVTLNPGTYFLDAGDLKIAGSSTIKGTDVTIILTTNGWPNSIGTIQVSGGSGLQISAPATGSTAGIALWVDSRAPLDANNAISGGSGVEVTGAIYAPSQLVNYSGGSSSGSSCTQLIADKIQFSGGSNFGNSCAGTGVSSIGGGGGVQLTN